MAHVTSVHYAISNPFIYTIIFNFIPLQGVGWGLPFPTCLSTPLSLILSRCKGALLNNKWQVFQISFGDTDIYINHHKD